MRVTRKFKRAITGFLQMAGNELSLKIEIFCAALVIGAAYYFKVERFEFLFLLLAVFGVIILEGLNTVLERVVDLVQPRYHEAVKEVKDALAAVVLLSVLVAAIIGLSIFWPYF